MELTVVGEQFDAHLRAHGRSEKTVIHYQDSRKLLVRFLTETGRDPHLEAITTQSLNEFAVWLRTTPLQKIRRGTTQRSEVGVHGALTDTKAFLRYLSDEEILTRPVKVPMPKLPYQLYPVLTDAELERIFASAELSPKTEIGARNRALVAFMLDTGVRLSEVAGLELANLDLKAGEARIRGKGQKERLVFFSDGAKEALRGWMNIRGIEPGPVFWLSAAGIRMVLFRIKRQTGLKQLSAHQLWHTCFTNLVRSNVDLHTVKRLAGHASVTTTESYLAKSGEDMKAKYKSASPFDRITKPAERQPRRRLKSA